MWIPSCCATEDVVHVADYERRETNGISADQRTTYRDTDESLREPGEPSISSPVSIAVTGGDSSRYESRDTEVNQISSNAFPFHSDTDPENQKPNSIGKTRKRSVSVPVPSRLTDEVTIKSVDVFCIADQLWAAVFRALDKGEKKLLLPSLGKDSAFRGDDACTSFVVQGFAQTIEDAVELGEMCREAGIISHVLSSHKRFANSSSLYYFKNGFFNGETEIIDLLETEAMDFESGVELTAEEIRSLFREHVSIADHTSGLKMYHHSFYGNKAIEELLVSPLIRNAFEASRLGNSLIASKLLHHVKDEQMFENKSHLYRFYEDEDETDALAHSEDEKSLESS